MTEIDVPRADETVAADTPPSFGRRLAAERERQGLSVDDIASRLRLHPRQVQAIENEALPALPAPFLRGFVRNYAKELRIDPAPLVAELSARLGPQSDEPPRTESGASAVPRLVTTELASRRVVVGGALAALVALAVLGWMATHSDRRAQDAPQPAMKPAEPAAAPTSAAPATEAQKAGTAQPAVASGVAPKQAADSPAVTTVAPAQVAATTSATLPSAAPAPVNASPQATPALDGLRLSFREQSWVEVTQADGRIVHSQINAAGSEQRIEGKPPLRLVVGNASAVSIDYKGKPVDLKPVTSADNVARITLN